MQDPAPTISPTEPPSVYRPIDPRRNLPGNDVQRTLAEGPGFALCDFHCPPGHPRWHHENRIADGFNLVFPRGAVEIAPAAHASFVADATRAVLYRDDARYRRRQLGPHGDRATVLLFAPDRVERALAESGGGAGPSGEAAPLDAESHLSLRRLRARLERTSRADPESERVALELLRRALGNRGESPRPPTPPSVRRAQALLNERHGDPVTVAGLARDVGVTAPHLCRAFRRHLGRTVHGYLVELRLRAAIDLLYDTELPLAEVALAAGFSHQSHLTETLRKATGTTPGRVRRDPHC